MKPYKVIKDSINMSKLNSKVIQRALKFAKKVTFKNKIGAIHLERRKIF